MALSEFRSDYGVVVKQQDGQGPLHYVVYHRTDDEPYCTADRVEINNNGAFVYGKLVVFGKVRVEKYPHKGRTRARITTFEENE